MSETKVKIQKEWKDRRKMKLRKIKISLFKDWYDMIRNNGFSTEYVMVERCGLYLKIHPIDLKSFYEREKNHNKYDVETYENIINYLESRNPNYKTEFDHLEWLK